MHHEVIILRHHLLPGAALPVWRIGTRGGSGAISDALRIQVIFDEIIKIAISVVTIIAHIILYY